MTEFEKMKEGLLHNGADKEMCDLRNDCKDLCFEYNNLKPSDYDSQQRIIRKIVKSAGENCTVTAPFWCDYGFNITFGDNFYSNHNMVILDSGKVTFGDNVFVGPDCGFYTPQHPIDYKLRNTCVEQGFAITVGDNVWFGGGVKVMPGVTIGSNVVIGGGSVVVKDIPDNCIAVGNPCKVIKKLEE